MSHRGRDQGNLTTPVSKASRRARQRGGRSSSGDLNARQLQYLGVFFQLDQEEERRQQRRWHKHLHRDHAADWRWIPYAVEKKPATPTRAQELIADQGLQDAGAGSTLAALFRRELIDVRHSIIDTAQGPRPLTEVRLTQKGRAVARSKFAQTPAGDQLPVWLHEALMVVAAGDGVPVPKTAISRAAARKLGAKEHGYIEVANAWAYQVSEAGHRYLSASEPPETQPSAR